MSKWITEAEDAEVARILRLTHKELVAEIKARGENEADVLARVRAIYFRAKREAYERR